MKINKETFDTSRWHWWQILAIILVVAICIWGTRAWFYNQSGLQTITQVTQPTTLTIMGKDKTAITQVDLSEIDLSKDYFDFVFCVVCSTEDPYQIELAHTTNIPFTYTIYSTEKTNYNLGDFLLNYTGDITKNIDENRSGGYINLEVNTNIADSSQHIATYPGGDSGYQYVQKNAEPLYWLSSQMTPVKDEDGDFVNYYVLRLTWEKSIVNNETYRRETDLVYLMAEN